MIWILILLDNLIFALFTDVYLSKQFKTSTITLCLPSSMPLLLQIKFYFLSISYKKTGSKGINTKQLCKTA